MIRVFKRYFSIRKLAFISGESALIFLAVTLATYILLGRGLGFGITFEIVWQKVLLITIITQLSLYFNDLYDFKNSDTAISLSARLIQAVGLSSIILAIIYFLIPDMVIGRWIFYASLVILLLFIVSWRFLYSLVIRKHLFTEKAIILGAGDLARDMLKEIKKRRDITYDIKYVVDKEKQDNPPEEFEGVPVQYGFHNICEIAEDENLAGIIVALDQKRGVMPYKELLNCKVQGINIIDGETFYERITEKLLIEKINPSWLIFSDGFVKSRFSKITKRMVGLILSSVMLIVLSPVMLLVALLIKLESPGPVIFSQERIGENGEAFILHKFRSMRADAEEKTGPVWATEDDPRVTRIGKIIRKLRIDELPQLWNVFNGSMSFVGPRPERRFFIDQLLKTVPYYNERFSVKPGVTGWAQIKYPYGATEKDALEKLKYDLYYIKNMSIAFDLIVIFHTIKIVLLGRGAR